MQLEDDAQPTQFHPELYDELRNAKLDAFRAFFEAWYPRVHRFAAQRVGAERAREITERVLSDAIGRIRIGDSPTAAAPWMLGLLKARLSEAQAG